MAKTIIIAFLFLFMQNNLRAQNFLNQSLETIKASLSSDSNINHSEQKLESDEIEIQFDFKDDSYKVYKVSLKKFEDGSFVCYKQYSIMPYSKEILNMIWKHFESLGYDKTNYKNQHGFPIFVSKDNNNHSIKHYLALSVKEDVNETYLVVEWVLNISEFILKD